MNTITKIANIVRVGVAGAVGAITVALYLGTRPDPALSPESIQSIRALDAANAESAPQQTVVNGWEANDLLAYMAEQQDAYASQQNLLLLIIAAIGALLLLSPILLPSHAEPRPAASVRPTLPTPTAQAHPVPSMPTQTPTGYAPQQSTRANYDQPQQ